MHPIRCTPLRLSLHSNKLSGAGLRAWGPAACNAARQAYLFHPHSARLTNTCQPKYLNSSMLEVSALNYTTSWSFSQHPILFFPIVLTHFCNEKYMCMYMCVFHDRRHMRSLRMRTAVFFPLYTWFSSGHISQCFKETRLSNKENAVSFIKVVICGLNLQMC